MKFSKITAKGQITIPSEIRERPGYGPGDTVSVFRDIDGRIYIESAHDAIERVAGMLDSVARARPPLSDQDMDELVGNAILEDYLASEKRVAPRSVANHG